LCLVNLMLITVPRALHILNKKNCLAVLQTMIVVSLLYC
jgi:hypothetical protein